MVFDRCYGCMAELPAPGGICRHCGYDNTKDLSTQPDHALPCGTVLAGHYVVGRVLGQGGFGISYIGWDLNLELRVCIKEYYPEGAAMRSASQSRQVYWGASENAQSLKAGRESFVKEARKAVKLRDLSHVVSVWGVFFENETAYIAMDYAEGETLRSRLLRDGTLTEKRCLQLLEPVIRDLEQVHARGIIHRDIKPDNLMLTPGDELMLLDLGAAKDLSHGSGQSSYMVASQGFSPLEQYKAHGEIGPWTDVYAMCATIYYCVTGKVLPAPVDRLGNDTLDVSVFTPAVGEVLKKGLALQAQERIRDMGTLAEALRAAVTPPAPEPKKKSRLPVILAAVLGAGVLFYGGMKFNEWQSRTAWSPSQIVESPTARFNKEQKSISRNMIDAGNSYTIAVRTDGTVAAAGSNANGQCNVSGWTNIIAVAAGISHTVGLKADGTVVAVGLDMSGRLDVGDWQNIVAIAAGPYNTVGLRADGTVAAVGNNDYHQNETSDWTDIIAIDAGATHTVGLKSDGSVVAAGSNQSGQCNVDSWRDIVAITAGLYHTVGLKSDGTVVAIGSNSYGQCDVADWTDIVAIAAGTTHTIGLKSDGTVVAVGSNTRGQCNVAGWRDITAIAAGQYNSLGLKADGTLLVIGLNDVKQCSLPELMNQ